MATIDGQLTDRDAPQDPRMMTHAGIAALAAVLLVAASVIQLAGPHTKVDEITLDLITAHRRFPLDLIGAVVNGFGSLALAWTLVYLFELARERNQQLQPFTRIIALGGGALAAIATVAYAIVIAAKADQFVTSGQQTYIQANHLTSSGAVTTLQILGQAGALLVAIAFVMVSLNAMRVGLLTRFMGYLGIFAGILVLFQFTQVPVVQAYWLLALAYLMTGRWPTGVPPSWRSGKAEPWPSSRELREQRMKSADGTAREKPAPKPEQREPVGASSARGTRSSTPKRKRKRRR